MSLWNGQGPRFRGQKGVDSADRQSLISGTFQNVHAGIAQLVERLLAMQKVASSSLVARSSNFAMYSSIPGVRKPGRGLDRRSWTIL